MPVCRVASAVICLSAAIASAEDPYEILWARQFGTSERDFANAVAVDGSGNLYVSGGTNGAVGPTSAGREDALLAKYDSRGALLWARQVGSTELDWSNAVAVDSTGNAYIVGTTWGNIEGTSAGYSDAFLAKYDSSGDQLWVRQFGTSRQDRARGVAVDHAGHVYVTGQFGAGIEDEDAFLAKYDSAGNRLWLKQLGVVGNHGSGAVAVDMADNVYIGGSTEGFSGPVSAPRDAYVAKLDGAGTLLWTSELAGPDNESVTGLALDSAGNAYITGHVRPGLDYDVHLSKCDASGTFVWTRRIGADDRESYGGVAVDVAGNAYVTGWTRGSLFGPVAGSSDAFLAKYTPDGSFLWGLQLGSDDAERDTPRVASGSDGKIYVCGATSGSVGGPSIGDDDAFLVALGAVCTADCDGDGALTLLDFLCFQNTFGAGDPAADCDGDGSLTFFDFLCFQNAFDAGCP
ncbi:MAG: SBBP repeat-containing protein [Phycisphaerales bacterium JB039]